MRYAQAAIATLVALGAGCSMVAGVRDLAYVDPPPPDTTTSSTEPGHQPAGATPSPRGDAATSASDMLNATPASGDASAAADAGIPEEPDAAADAGAVIVPPPPPPPPPGPGCGVLDFVLNDRRGANAARTITFGAAGPYSPRCMSIRIGQSVTWEGDFTLEPLAARSQNPPSPITLVAAGATATFTFTQMGTYRYGSTADATLQGAIDVRP